MRGCRPLSPTEVGLVDQAINGRYQARDRALFWLGIKTGYRISELLSLRIRDVTGPNGAVLDRVHVARQNVKGQTEGRIVVLHPKARAVLAAYLSRRGRDATNPAAYVFPRRGDPTVPIGRVQAWRMLKRAFLRAGIGGQTGTHTLRKTFADRVHKGLGGDLVKTQRAMGHRNINSTVAYLSFADEEVEAAILGT